nr:EOG090X0D84 [Ilyocryptus agilis]
MKRKIPVEEESSSESVDSDEELQQAFEKGEVKPGLNIKVEAPRHYANNVPKLEGKAKEMALKLDWIEKLDLTTDLQDIVSGILEDKEVITPSYKIETPGDQIVDDLQRETLFYRQAQVAVIEGLARLKALGVPTKRPEDYFAQMAKSDDHMLKVKRKILAQQMSQEKAQKVKKLRELKKYGKKVQVEVGLQRAKEKREMLSKVKQFREGKLASLDFLDEKDDKKRDILQITKQKTKEKNEAKRFNQVKDKGKLKRNEKDKKFGFGGKKKGKKQNNVKKDGPSSKKSVNFKAGQSRNKNKPKRRQGGNKAKGGGRNKR